MTDLASMDATAQADLVRRGDASAIELVEAACTQIEALDPVLGVLALSRFDEARDAARGPLPDGPFRGVPTLVKDLGCTSAGERFTDGTRFLKEAGARAAVTETIAARIDAAGFVRLGRTKSPEIGLLPTTEPLAWGPAANPWDPSRSTGGSSGGSAAAVAAGLVPVAHGTDGGGSLRIPASCCGVLGLKPSRGRVPAGPFRNEMTSPFSVHFFLTRSVRDAAALLHAVSGPSTGDQIIAPGSTDGTPDDRALRIGLMTRAPGGEPVDADCVAAAELAAHALAARGHIVEQAHPAAWDDFDLAAAFGVTWSVTTAARVRGFEQLVGREAGPDDLEPLTWERVLTGRKTDALAWTGAMDTLASFTRAAASWWDDGWDLLLTPTLGTDPPPLGSFPADDAARAYGLARGFVPFTAAWNATGQPAISVPVHTSAARMPAGAQLVAAYGREDLLLRVAAELEEELPWSDRVPTVWAS